MKVSSVLILPTILLFTTSANAVNFGLSVADINIDQQRCFKQTELIHQNVAAKTLSTRSCDRVITNPWAPRKLKAGVFHNRGLINAYKGHTEKAENDFRYALNISSKHASTHIALAQILTKRNSFAEAIYHYDRAIDLGGNKQLIVQSKKRVESLMLNTLAKNAPMKNQHDSAED